MKSTTAGSAIKRRDADVAYEAIEALIATVRLQPGSPVVEAEIAEQIQLGRTPVREALMRLMSGGLIVQQPRRGLLVSPIDLANHLDVIQTRRALERVIAACSARRATAAERDQLVACADRMVAAAKKTTSRATCKPIANWTSSTTRLAVMGRR